MTNKNCHEHFFAHAECIFRHGKDTCNTIQKREVALSFLLCGYVLGKRRFTLCEHLVSRRHSSQGPSGSHRPTDPAPRHFVGFPWLPSQGSCHAVTEGFCRERQLPPLIPSVASGSRRPTAPAPRHSEKRRPAPLAPLSGELSPQVTEGFLNPIPPFGVLPLRGEARGTPFVSSSSRAKRADPANRRTSVLRARFSRPFGARNEETGSRTFNGILRYAQDERARGRLWRPHAPAPRAVEDHTKKRGCPLFFAVWICFR